MSDSVVQKLRFKGVPVYMNGKNYYIPSLSTRQYEENQAFLAAGIPEGTPADKAAVWFHPVILLAIQRNYPEVTSDDLLDWIDFGTGKEIMEALTASSKLEAVSGGE